MLFDLAPTVAGALCGILAHWQQWDERPGLILISLAALLAANTAALMKRICCWAGLFLTMSISLSRLT